MEKKHDLSRFDLEILSDVLMLALHSDKYINISISDFYNKFIETIKAGDFRMIRDEESGLAIAFTSWSFVSDEILDDMLKNDRAIKKEEMNSGDNLLFIEFFSTNSQYWNFFDHLTDYFNNEYEGKYEVDTTKIYTCCGLKIGFDDTGVKIIKVEKE